MTLRVIGAGLGRTGTASLKSALEMIGLGPCYHMSEVVGNPVNIEKWLAVADGAPDWDGIFDGYHAAVDYPVAAYWRELGEHYPDAKFILTVRDPERWYESTQETIFSPELDGGSGDARFDEMKRRVVNGTMGGRIHDRDHMIAHFERHNRDVREALPEERLLVYEVKEGWAPLCGFLGCAAPDRAFPSINSREQFKRLFGGSRKDAGTNR